MRLVKDGREANARSVVSIMALEVAGGDTVSIVARGHDAPRLLRRSPRSSRRTSTLRRWALHALSAGRSIDRAVVGDCRRRFAPMAHSSECRRRPASPSGKSFGCARTTSSLEERGAEPAQEQRALDTAIAAARLQLESLQRRLTEEADADRAAIFAAHQELLEDPEVLERAATRIRMALPPPLPGGRRTRRRRNASWRCKNPVLAGRATDLRDIGRRVLNLLVGRAEASIDVPPESIVVAEDLTPSDTASLDRTRVRGLLHDQGGATSHVAILARGLGIPAIAGVDPRVLDLTPRHARHPRR